MKERKDMFRLTKMKSRIMAGFLAFVLVMSNIAANVQTVYAFGGYRIERDEDGNVIGYGDYVPDDSDNGDGADAEEEKDWDVEVDIWPEMKAAGETGDEAAEEDAGDEEAKVWTGKWIPYRYDGVETSESLSQMLLGSDKYKDEYGDLDVDLPGTWEGDNDDVMEVYEDGTALVKDEGIVNVTFTYEGEEKATAPADKVAPANPSSSGAETGEAANPETVAPSESAGTGETAENPEDAGTDAEAADSEATAPAESQEDGAETGSVPETTLAAEETESSDAKDPEASDEASESSAAVETDAETVEDTEAADTDSDAAAETESTEVSSEGKEEEASDAEESGKEDYEVIVEANVPLTDNTADVLENEPKESVSDESDADLAEDGETEDEVNAGDEAATEDEAKAEGNANAEDSAEAEDSANAEDGANAGDAAEAADDIEADAPEDGEQIPIATGSDATPSKPAADGKKELKAGDTLTWVVKVRYSGPALMAGSPNLSFEKTAGKSGKLEYSDGVKTATITGSGILTVKGTYNGKIIIEGGSVTITGENTPVIDADGRNASAIYIKKGTVTLGGGVTVQNGKGTEVTNALEPGGSYRVGGGVYVESGTFKLNNGTITSNTAQRGGGIFVNHGAKLIMNGGVVSNNQTVNKTKNDKYAGEGGGIFVWGTATIKKGKIINNVCNSKTDLGGGGLYVNNDATAVLMNAKITGNTAEGFGGGIAGCVHGESSLVAKDGVALYGNTANGTAHTLTDKPRKTAGNKVDYYTQATTAGITGANSADFYTAGSCIVGNYMPGGGSAKYKVRYMETSGTSGTTKALSDDVVEAYEGKVVALKANPTQESKDKVPTVPEKGVLIEGNRSTVHGGGIGCNGGLYFGAEEDQEFEFDLLELELDATKKLSVGGNPAKDAYTFDLFYSDGKRAKRVKNDANGKIAFKFNDYEDVSTHFDKGKNQITFRMKEVIPSSPEPGMVYDKSEYKVVVTLNKNTTTDTVVLDHTTDNNTFKKITVTYVRNTWTKGSVTIYQVMDKKGNVLNPEKKLDNNKEATFVNGPSVTYVPNVKKLISGDAVPTANPKTFTFTLTANSDNRGGAELSSTSVAITTDGKTGNTASFGPITFKKEGTYNFTIAESEGGDAGYTYDRQTWNLNVEVVKSGSQLQVKSHTYTRSGSPNSDQEATFTNTYQTTPTTYSVGVNKTVSGYDAPSETFTFTLTPDGNNPLNGVSPAVSQTITITAGNNGDQQTTNGNNNFPQLTFSKAGTYKFTIKETGGSTPGYSYDTVDRILTITVEDKESKLTVTNAKMSGGGSANTSSATAGIINNYNLEDVSYNPQVKKTVKGDARTNVKQTFTFELSEDSTRNPSNGAILPANNTVTVTDTGVMDFESTVEFAEPITFKRAGTYYFKIKEQVGNAAGYVYDPTEWTLTVPVTRDGNQLKVGNVTYTASDGTSSKTAETAEFTNTYKLKDTTWSPQVKKQISGSVRPENNKKTFTFKLVKVNDNPASPVEAPGAELPNGNTELTVQVTDEGTGTFDAIKFTKPGAYTFEITEDTGSDSGYTYSNQKWQVEVVVTDENSQLTPTVNYYLLNEDGSRTETSSTIEAVFDNEYHVTHTTYAPMVKKDIAGVDSWDKNSTFTFSIAPSNDAAKNSNNVEMPENTSVNVTGVGTSEFDNITFKEAGTYTFTISENSEVPKGFTRDEKTWTLTVVVVDNDSRLSVERHTYQQNGATDSNTEQATFTNNYSVTPTKYAPKATKQVIGEAVPEEKYFQFDLTAANVNAQDPEKVEMPSELTVEIKGLNNWQVSSGQFDDITFKQAGEYEFTITEKSTVPDGYTYDPKIWTVKVTVIDDNSELKVKNVVYVEPMPDGTTREHTDVENFVVAGEGAAAGFVNHYAVKPVTYAPKVSKAINGDALPPTDRTFTFTLEHGFWYPNGVLTDDGAVMPADPTATVTGVGFGNFADITFTKAGTYNFSIKETDESGEGFLYDDTVWNLEVTIEDKESQLTVTNVSYTKVSGGSTNNTGAELSGDPKAEDSNLYASFYNEYHVIPAETQIHVTKYVTGSVRPEVNVATFNFRMSLVGATATNGVELPENTVVSITGSGDPGKLGEADFGPIKFTKAGTYMFEIDEMTGFEEGTEQNTGYTYDNGTWKVTVEVVDDGGTLIVKDKKYSRLENGELADMTDIPEEEGARFTNSYDVVDTTYAPKVSKEFARSSAPRPTEETFTFNLELPEGVDYGEAVEFEDSDAAKQVTVTGAGIASFAKITFHEAGTYKFILSEANERKGGYTYDPTKWELTVEVVDRGDWETDNNTLIVNTVSYNQIETEGQTGELKSSAEMATFTNDYVAAEASYSPNVSKTITGEKRPIEKDFTFEIEAVENGYTPPAYALAMESGLVMPENTTATVTGEGTASFEAIKFTSAGTYKFVIHEANDQLPGYEYDSTEWNLTVVVVDEDGKLVVDSDSYTWSKGADAGYSSWGAAFTNDYQVKPTVYAPSVKKTVLGNPLEEEQFNFTMESGEGNDADGFAFAEGDSGHHVTVNGAGTGNFGDITFKKAGTYTFKIKETSSNSPFWVDDDRTWTLTVVVEDQDAQLVVTSNTYARDGEGSVTSDTEAEFENEYHGPGDLSIEKTVSGNRGERTRAFNFTVTLTNQKGEPLAGTYEYVGESTIDGVEAPASGTVSGGALTITLMHGQKITIKGVPSDTKYTVTETEADTEGYRTTVEVGGASQTEDVAEGSIARDEVIEVEYLNYRNRTPSTPGGPGPGPGPEGPGDNPGPGFELITDEPTPLGSLTNIEDEDTPLAFLAPATGDEKPVGAAALFSLLALGMMGAFGIRAFKKDEEEA